MESEKFKTADKAGENKACPAEVFSCELCGSSKNRTLYRSLPKLHRCLDCGLVYTHPMPTPAELMELYDDQYFVSHSSTVKGYDNYLRDRDNICRTFRKRFGYIRRFLAQPGRVLDVGCAAGFFLSVAREMGWDAEGLDISDFAVELVRAEGFKAFCGPLENFPQPEKPYDLVTMWDVIEHVPSPKAYLERIGRLLRPGGYLVIATPVIDSLPRMIFGDRWMGFKEHEHLYFFSSKTLGRILRQTGFNPVFSKLEGKYISFDLFKRRIGCYSRPVSGILRKFFSPKAVRPFDFYINPWDIRLVIARKEAI